MDVYNEPETADAFNNFFTNIGQKLFSQILRSSKTFETCINKVNVLCAFIDKQVKRCIFYASFDIINKFFGVLYEPLIYLFQLSFKKRVFSDDLKISKVTPIYKAGDSSSDISNYRPIPLLPCFSDLLQRFMYNRFYKYLDENNIFYEKQFGFYSRYSTNEAIIQLVEKEQFTLGVFIDLSRHLTQLIIPSY